jgi:hypothetical protein
MTKHHGAVISKAGSATVLERRGLRNFRRSNRLISIYRLSQLACSQTNTLLGGE